MTGEKDFGPQQLANWLGIAPRHLRRAETRGLIPPPDVADERWSLSVARTLVDRVETIVAAVDDERYPVHQAPAGTARRRVSKRDSFGPHQLAKELGLQRWQAGRAEQRGLIPPPDVDGTRWSREVVEALHDRVPEICEVLGDHPGLGSIDAATRLAARTGLLVERPDVRTLADQGLLRPVGEFRGHPMYGLDGLDGLPEEHIVTVVRQREEWIARSLTAKEAAALLGWAPGRFEVTAERSGLCPGPLDRYDRAQVEQLPAADGGA
ncbi:hypothetical protein [Streptomyces sp. NPDC017993]|uniref:hypothetical protein n=1 Tax=Streptomyces sp. NPDC017993 TaxID=3365027 RepID=UPI0037BA71E0